MDFKEAYKDTCSNVGIAAREGNLDAVKRLLREGRPLDVKDNRGWRPIHEAAFNNHPECLQELLNNEVCDVNWRTFEEETPLLLAARAQSAKCMEILFKHAADIDLVTNEYYTVLWEATRSGCLDCVKCALSHGGTSLINKQIYTGSTPLLASVDIARVDIMTELLDHGADLTICEDFNISPIFSAAQYGQLACLEKLLTVAKERDQLDCVNIPASDGATPLYLAAQNQYYLCVQLLLKNGADPNIMAEDPEYLPLHAAISGFTQNMEHSQRCIELLLPVTDKTLFSKCEVHPLQQALEVSNYDCIEMFIREGTDHLIYNNLMADIPDLIGVDLFSSPFSYSRDLPLISYATLSKSSNSCMTSLLKLGCRVNVDCDSTELPPLVAAVYIRDAPLVIQLLENGASMNIYHSSIAGNVPVLLSVNRTGILSPCFHHLLINNCEIGSCLNEIGTKTASGEPRWNLIDHVTGFHDSSIMARLLLACLSNFSWFIRFDDQFQHYMDADDYEELNEVSEMSHKLSHLCRRKIILHLLKQGQYASDVLNSLTLPKDLVHFLEFGYNDPSCDPTIDPVTEEVLLHLQCIYAAKYGTRRKALH